MGRFFIDTSDGYVATHRQLLAAGVMTESDDDPPRPWHPLQASGDTTTMWFAIYRKRLRGIYIGAAVLRHSGREPSLIADGWEEVPIADIGHSLRK